MIDAVTAPRAPAEVPAKTSRVWRMVLIVLTVQLVLIAAGMTFFNAVGLASGGGTCGGG